MAVLGHPLAVEVDGGVPDSPAQALLDADHQSLVEEQGSRFLRLSAEDVERDLADVLETIATAVGIDSPSPAKSGEGAGG